MSRLSKPLPEGTIDSHCHIIPPDFERFPILKTAQYKPKPHTLSDATLFYNETSGLGIFTPRMVLTQVSIYGTDNSAVLSGVADLGSNGRGVAEFSPDISVDQLQELWRKGIRGVRINLVSRSAAMEESQFETLLQSYVDKLSQMKMSDSSQKWVIEMYIPLSYMPMLVSILRRLRNGEAVRWCVDHFGGLDLKKGAPDFQLSDDPYSVTGFKELVQLVSDPTLPEAYVKLSAAYRIEADYPSKKALDRLGRFGRELIHKAEDRVCWASDWPHTRFEQVDSVPFVEACYEWCGEGEEGEIRRHKLFKINSERLWDMARDA